MSELSPYTIKALNDHRLDVLDYLLASGEPIDGDQGKLLCMAVAAGNIHAIGLLVHRYHADVLVADHFPVRIAAQKGQLRALVALHTLGADLHAHDEDALLRAAFVGNQAVVSYLLSQKCDAKQVKKAFALAKKAGHFEIAEQIRLYLLQLPKELHKMLWHGEWKRDVQLANIHHYPCHYLIVWQMLGDEFVAGHISGYVGHERFTFKLFYCVLHRQEVTDCGFGKDQLLNESFPRAVEQQLLNSMADAFLFFIQNIDEVAFLRNDGVFLPRDHALCLTQYGDVLKGGSAPPPVWINSLLSRAAILARPLQTA